MARDLCLPCLRRSSTWSRHSRRALEQLPYAVSERGAARTLDLAHRLGDLAFEIGLAQDAFGNDRAHAGFDCVVL